MQTLIWFLNPSYSLVANLIDLNEIVIIKNTLKGFPLISNRPSQSYDPISIFLRNELNGSIIYYDRTSLMSVFSITLLSVSLPQFLYNNGIRYEAFVINLDGINGTIYLYNNSLKTPYENNQLSIFLKTLPYHKESVINMIHIDPIIAINMPCVMKFNTIVEKIETVDSIINFIKASL